MSLISGATSGRFLNHSQDTGAVNATRQHHTPGGSFDGTLWEVVDLGGGRGVLLRGVTGRRYLNHSAATGEVTAVLGRYDPDTGVYDGTLWHVIDAGAGRVLLRGATSGRYLNHDGQTGQVAAILEHYDSVTGAFDGTLWLLEFYLYEITNNGKLGIGGEIPLKNGTSRVAIVATGSLALPVTPDSETTVMQIDRNRATAVSIYRNRPDTSPVQTGQVNMQVPDMGLGGHYEMQPDGQLVFTV